MTAVALALFAGMLTIAAPCTLPVLPACLARSVVRKRQGAAGLYRCGTFGLVRHRGCGLQRHHPSFRHRPDRAAHRSRRTAVDFRRPDAVAASFEWAVGRAWARGSFPANAPLCALARGNAGGFCAGHDAWPGVDAVRRSGAGLDPHLDRHAAHFASGALLLSFTPPAPRSRCLAIAWGGQAATARVRVFARSPIVCSRASAFWSSHSRSRPISITTR